MAQGRVTDFFSTRKRPLDFQPSKRRKIQNIIQADQSSEVLPELKKTTPVSRRTRTRAVNKDAPADLNVQLQQTVRLKGNKEQDAGAKSKTPAPKTRARGRPKKTAPAKTDIGDILKHIDSCQAKDDNTKESDCASVISLSSSAESEVSCGDEEVTAACDDHVSSPPGTPTKRSTKSESETVNRKRSRHSKTVRRDLLQEPFDGFKTPESGYDFSKYTDGKISVKKKLVLQAERKSPSTTIDPGVLSLQLKAANVENESKEEQLNTVEEPKATSKAKPTIKSKSKSEGKQVELDKLNLSNVKDKLAKCGKLEELQARLAQFSEQAAKVNQIKKANEKLQASADQKEAESDKKEKAPAYERFHSLAVPVPPSLSLPYKFKLLLEMFNSVEIVVSMLYKRHEICNFTKLKKAVQEMMRKAFEEKNLGQIKQVYPTAYVLRQETGLPVYGGKKSGYQLTIEPDLRNCNAPDAKIENSSLDKNGRPAFTATKLIERKEQFHRLLINIVKKHHQDFLSSLDRPLSIPDHKITRWHPRFCLDEVPSIEPASLPQPPDVKKFSSAQEVLDQARNQISNPRVKKALELIAKQSAAKKNSPCKTPSKLEKTILNSPGASPKLKKDNSPVENVALKGVSQSLLDKIRAKESIKQEIAMMRTPAEEKRRVMLGRMPEIIRIIRLFFVTLKKPALPMETVCQKVMDSYRSNLGPVEAENHVKLMVELVPEWAKIVQISKGRFLSVDKNKDVAVFINKVQKMEKEAR